MLKQVIKAAVSSGVGWKVSALLRSQGVVVLMYHRITREGDPFPGTTVDRFARQMRWLKTHSALIAPEEYLEATRRADRRRPPVLITFDDGYRDYYDSAYPVLSELRIPAIVFLATSFMDTNRLIWTEAVSWAFRHTRRPELELPWLPRERHSLADLDARLRVGSLAKQHLKDIPDSERQRLQAHLYTALDVDPEAGSAGRQMLSWQEVRATLEYTRFGGHTHTHPILSQLSASEADHEIRLCRDRIAEETGHAPRYFAYPNGRAGDFTSETQASLKRHGFELGFSTIEGVNGPKSDPYEIHRQPTWGTTIGEFAWLVAGH